MAATRVIQIELDVVSYSACLSACEKALQWPRGLQLLECMSTEVPRLARLNHYIDMKFT